MFVIFEGIVIAINYYLWCFLFLGHWFYDILYTIWYSIISGFYVVSIF